ncbi:MAG: molybdopterin-dependent oxidoreductase [Candidatus Eisenbacteria bacterium]|uniref:Molybdopterin-dependent oxidoreductase n=1 Tax=Eiseniibacteriota bacterium TaxID=2212470 RepID=A0A948W7E3_UNCEI|nr:molybdopterin-dependent oxidoreductase [Candidatus Eisenbacteria bacterium]MBU1948894.1 molybdopterin-dependent oxidoreductase [Candidatus Eisenbacteria bacterium]MBU2691541.1 molybdopterin-dependent oxidoreductase [Candidatus Eisenbacteria bacterium]
MAKNKTIRMDFNGRTVTAPEGSTVLRAAELNGIYIPTLCSHKDLSPFGGCRMCIVEIEGIRGYPLSCYTTAAEGMKVKTDTKEIVTIRKEILQLILSEHPSTCLVCDERVECRNFMGTVRKSGVTTGCHYCPSDQQCELQTLVEKLGIEELEYPILYRGDVQERGDPFYDRDYNLCILCGRCVRMCQEMRGTSVLAFTHRGSKAIVGPAFGRNHQDAGCEFCGACVEVCPTGALAEKACKWDGKPDGAVTSTCPYCAIGCQLDFHSKSGRFMKALPVAESDVNDGQACLKGRFCIGELSHHFGRNRKPFARENNYWKEKPWTEALDIAAEKLKGVKSSEFAMLVSSDCTNESLYMAQKFVRSAMGANSIDNTGRQTLGGGLKLWTELLGRPISIQDIRSSSRILAVGLDTRFNYSIVGVEIRKAMQHGAGVVTIGPRESNLARYADIWLQSPPGFEGTALKAIIKGTAAALAEGAKATKLDLQQLGKAASLLKSGEDLTVILGPSLFRYSVLGDLVDGLRMLLSRKNVKILPLYTGANTRGALEMGAFSELLPGPAGIKDKDARLKLEKRWNQSIPSDNGFTAAQVLEGKKKYKVLYMIGSQPGFDRPNCDFLIVQDIFEPNYPCDLFLPAASFLESAGTLVNIEGRVQDAPKIESPPDSVMHGRTRPDWWILSEIAKRLGAVGFDYEAVGDIQREIAAMIPGYPKGGKTDRSRRVLPELKGLSETPPADGRVARAGKKLVLALRPMGYTHRGVSLTAKVEGLQILNPETGFFLSREDAEKLGITAGDHITVRAGSIQGAAPVKIEPELQQGAIYLYIPEAVGGLMETSDLAALYRLKKNPCPVEVIKNGV